MRFLLATIGYTAVATLIAATLGLGYLWQSERLTDEKVFEIVALVHGVELDRVEDATATSGRRTPGASDLADAEAPPEEPSLVEAERLRAIALRNHEARSQALSRGKAEFTHQLSKLVEQRDRFDDMARELQQRLDQESAENAQEGVRNLVRDLKKAKPDKGKQMLLRLLERGSSPDEKLNAMDEVIRIINAMPADTWEQILNRFDGGELEQLHELQVRQLEGGAKQQVLNEAMRQLRDRDFGS
ncbi:MAG: hypothetical protein AAF805_03545 [Planctomycetota bacterium]